MYSPTIIPHRWFTPCYRLDYPPHLVVWHTEHWRVDIATEHNTTNEYLRNLSGFRSCTRWHQLLDQIIFVCVKTFKIQNNYRSIAYIVLLEFRKANILAKPSALWVRFIPKFWPFSSAWVVSRVYCHVRQSFLAWVLLKAKVLLELGWSTYYVSHGGEKGGGDKHLEAFLFWSTLWLHFFRALSKGRLDSPKKLRAVFDAPALVSRKYVCKYAIICVNLQWHFFYWKW